jgi:hypothetical protein
MALRPPSALGYFNFNNINRMVKTLRRKGTLKFLTISRQYLNCPRERI